MRSKIALFLSFSIFFNACSSIKIKGEAFYRNKDSELEKLVKLLDEGIKNNNLSAEEVSKKIPVKPQQISIDEKSENWFYQHSQTSGKIKLKLINVSNKEITEAQEMELVFNKEKRLISYKIRTNSTNPVDQKIQYGYLLIQGLIVGGAAVGAFKFIK